MDQPATSDQPPGTVRPRAMSHGLKMALEMGPLFLFLLANFRPKLFEPLLRLLLPATLLEGKDAGLITSTSVLMIAVVVALIISFAKIRRLPMMPLVTAIMVLVFGGLTLYFKDQSFIQIKVTIIYTMFGLALLGGLLLKRPLLPIMLDSAMTLTEKGWSILTFRWGLFFLFLAGLNEIMRAVLTWDHWLFFKFPGTMIVIFLFTFTQVPFIMRHELKDGAAGAAPDHL
jgi:intracellular septation protein